MMSEPVALTMIVEMAETMHAEGFIFSEAYPVVRWKANGWPEVDIFAFRLMDAYMKYRRLCDEYR